MSEFFSGIVETIKTFVGTTGIAKFCEDPALMAKTLIMSVIIGALFYLAIAKKFEPLLLVPIAFGMLLANLPGANLFHMDLFLGEKLEIAEVIKQGGLIDLLYLGVKIAYVNVE